MFMAARRKPQNYMATSQRLRQLRIAHGYALRHVSAATGITLQNVCRLERGATNVGQVNLGTMVKYARFYGVTLEYLIADVVFDTEEAAM